MARHRVGRCAVSNVLAGPAPSSMAASLAAHANGSSSLNVNIRIAPMEFVSNVCLATKWQDCQRLWSELPAANRHELRPDELAVLWVRLAKVAKDPAVRGAPDLQKFVDILACATIDRIQQFSAANLCSVIWAASKLKRDMPKSGMFKSFLKTWAAEMEPHLESLELEQVRKCMSAITRVNYDPSPTWRLRIEATLASRLANCACPKTLACCLVSAASLGFALHPSPAFRSAVAAACRASFTPMAVARASMIRTGTRDAARCACSSLWAAAVLGVPLERRDVQVMLSHVTSLAASCAASAAAAAGGQQHGYASGSASAPGAGSLGVLTAAAAAAAAGAERAVGGGWRRLEAVGGGDDDPAVCSSGPATKSMTPLDVAQVVWALSKLRYTPDGAELLQLLSATSAVLPAAPPVLLATIMWGLADMQVVPPEPWLELTYRSFEAQLDAASAEPLQALLHAAASLQLPAPQWSGRLMQRLQDVDLQALPDGNIVDLVMSMHALHMHPPPLLAARLQSECMKRLGTACTAAAPAAAPPRDNTGSASSADEGDVAPSAAA